MVVIRAAPTRRDNVVFGILAMTDAAMIVWRSTNVLAGESIVSPPVTVPCAMGTIVLSLLTMEFLAAFPRRPAMRHRWRFALVAWAVLAIGLLAVLDAGRPRQHLWLTQ